MFEKNLRAEKTSWKFFFNDFLEIVYFTDHLNFHKKNIFSLIFVFDNVSLETLNMLYILNKNYSFVQLKNVEKNKIENDLEYNYQLNDATQRPKIHNSTMGFLINTNPRYEGYLLNLSLRQRFLKGNFRLLTIGPVLDLTVPVYNLGSNITVLKSIGEGTHLVCQDIRNSEFPLLISNMEFYKRSDSNILTFIFKQINRLDNAWNGFSVLNPNLSSAGMHSLNKFLHFSSEDILNFFGLYVINASFNSISNVKNITELYLLKQLDTENGFKNKKFINQGVESVNDFFYGKVKDKMVKSYFHLPTNMVYEDNETYVNTQGLIKRMGKLLHFKKDAKTNWQLTRKLYSNINSLTFYNNTKDNKLIQFDCINSFDFKNYISFNYSVSQSLTSLSYYLTKQNSPIIKPSVTFFKSTKVKVFNTKIKYWLDDFYNSNGRDSFSYNSSVLASCSKVLRSSSTNFF